jgi:DNA-directed RNA polymerase specialized sigma24 family protein
VLTGSREDAEDLMQETCAKVLAKCRTISSAEDALRCGTFGAT